ncbi:MAG TPA: hypothetical protein VFZ91_02250 [Allosphingosinicella sp.]
MSDSRFVAESIEELLVALAVGIREAQEALSETMPFDRFGRPLPSYHIPYLDFQIAVDVETERQGGGGRPVLRIRQAAPAATSSQTSRTSSTLSGRLVAVPPGEGLPLPAMQLTSEATGARTRRIVIQLSNSVGELLPGQKVELNIDPAASDQLSRANAAKKPAPQPGTQLSEAVLVTDDKGEAATTLTLGAEDEKAIVVLKAQVGVATARISVTAETPR